VSCYIAPDFKRVLRARMRGNAQGQERAWPHQRREIMVLSVRNKPGECRQTIDLLVVGEPSALLNGPFKLRQKWELRPTQSWLREFSR
jgi:hypothetical protein